MKNPTDKDTAGTFVTGISLRHLLNDLIRNLPAAIVQNKIFVDNEIPTEFKILAHQTNVVSVINELLTTVVTNARNTHIVLTAEKFNDIVILNIEDRNNYNGYALSFSLMSIGQQARYAGGDVSITGARQRVATVSFSFPDAAAVRHYIY